MHTELLLVLSLLSTSLSLSLSLSLSWSSCTSLQQLISPPPSTPTTQPTTPLLIPVSPETRAVGPSNNSLKGIYPAGVMGIVTSFLYNKPQ